MLHNCIKCSTQYDDQDPDPYLCAQCSDRRRQIALAVDAKFAGRSTTKPKTDLELYDEQLAQARASGMTYPKG